MKWLLGLVGALYPLLIAAGLVRFEPRTVALPVLGLILARAWLGRHALARLPRATSVAGVAALATLAAFAALANSEASLLLLPACVSLALMSFGLSTLIAGRPLIESLARMQVDSLSEPEVRYCRQITWVWVGFLAANGAAIVALALLGQRSHWALYTGVISYLLIGALFASEYVYRHYRFRRYLGAPTDPLLMRMFPPREGGR